MEMYGRKISSIHPPYSCSSKSIIFFLLQVKAYGYLASIYIICTNQVSFQFPNLLLTESVEIFLGFSRYIIANMITCLKILFIENSGLEPLFARKIWEEEDVHFLLLGFISALLHCLVKIKTVVKKDFLNVQPQMAKT